MTSARTCNIVGSEKIPLANNGVTSYTGKRQNPSIANNLLRSNGSLLVLLYK